MFLAIPDEEIIEKWQNGERWPVWAQMIDEEAYIKQVYRLQNEAGLSFKEARAVLNPYEESIRLALEWGITKEEVLDLRRCGQEKVEKATGGDSDKYGDLVPTYMCHAF